MRSSHVTHRTSCSSCVHIESTETGDWIHENLFFAVLILHRVSSIRTCHIREHKKRAGVELGI